MWTLLIEFMDGKMKNYIDCFNIQIANGKLSFWSNKYGSVGFDNVKIVSIFKNGE